MAGPLAADTSRTSANPFSWPSLDVDDQDVGSELQQGGG